MMALVAARRRPSLLAALPWLVGLLLAAFAMLWLWVAIARIFYPFDVDFLEDDILVEAWRFAHGLPVFAAPNADFVPHAYAPLYMLLSAPALLLTGPSFLPMRLLSFGATLVSAAVLFWAAYRTRRRVAIALMAPGIFVAGYALTGAQFELARVDALFIALILAGTLGGITSGGSRHGRLLAALLLALAFFSKQTAFVFGVGMAAYLFWAHRRPALDFAVAYLAAVIVPMAVLDRLSGGWSTFYLLVVPQGDPVELARIIDYARHDLLQSLGPLCALLVVLLALRTRGLPPRSELTRAWPLFALLAVLTSGWMRARTGGNLNSLLPAYAFLSLVPALLYLELAAETNGSESSRAEQAVTLSRTNVGTSGVPALAASLLCLAVLWQLAAGIYNPLSEIPRGGMRESGQRLVERIREAGGPVLVLEHPLYALLAGKTPGVSLTALWHARLHGRLSLPPDLVDRVRNRYYALVVTDDGEYPEVSVATDTLLNASYALQTLQPADDGPPTLSGLVVRPHYFYLPEK